MPSTLQHIQLTYHPLEDRLILTFFTSDFSEFRFWLTRNCTQALWQMLKELLKKIGTDPSLLSQEKKVISHQIQEEKKQHHAEAEKYGTPMSRTPFGKEPILINKIAAKEVNGLFLISFEDVKGHIIEFNGQYKILIALEELVQQLEKKAKWNLSL